jgi:hypothetical protein
MQGWRDPPNHMEGKPMAITTETRLAAAAISSLIAAKLAEGQSLREAFDAVIGEGAYLKFAGDLWESLQPA